MALDETLLGDIKTPLLRVYKWDKPTVSFGYFEKYEPVRTAYTEWDLVRRWTGGGVVEHGRDFTYSLIIPAGHDFLGLRTAESYERVHGCVMAVLNGFGIQSNAADGGSARVSQACFENPAQFDVLVDGRKVAGAAQRRSRKGLLHQGSIQIPAIPAGLGDVLAAQMANRVMAFELEAPMLDAAHDLARNKYASLEWTAKY